MLLLMQIILCPCLMAFVINYYWLYVSIKCYDLTILRSDFVTIYVASDIWILT